MNKEKLSFLAVIPARGGSKRLPNKNLLDLVGKPLINYTIDASLKSKYITKTIVSSDDDKILEVAKLNGSNIIKRPVELASDHSSSFSAVEHTILNQNKKFDYVVLLQPTSPLRDETDIDNAIELLKKKKADAIISVSQLEHSPLWSNTLPKNNSLVDFLDSSVLNSRSQDLETYYRLNGAIYICKTDLLLKERTFFLNNNIYGYKMDKESSVDIDDIYDFKLAECIINSREKKE